MTLNYVADTNILILYFAGRLQDSLPLAQIGISVISEIEMLSWSGLTAEDEQQLRTILNNFNLCFLSDEIKEQTIAFRKKYKLKIPDAIICATAIAHQSILLTNDKQLLNLSGLKAQSLAIKG